MDPESTARTQSLIDQLDEKIASLNATRVDPADIAQQFSSNLQNYVTQLIANFLMMRERTEQESRKPRDVIKQIIPIDIVSITPGAADQIVQALAAAGLGKYKLNIKQVSNQVQKSDSTSGGMSAGVIAAVGAGAAFVVSTLAAFIDPISNWLTEKFNWMSSFLPGSEDEEQEFLGGANSSTLQSEKEKLDTLAYDLKNNPSIMLQSSYNTPKPDDVTKTSDLKEIRDGLDEQSLIPSDQSGDEVTPEMVKTYIDTRDAATDQFLNETDSGKQYVDSLLNAQSRQSVSGVQNTISQLEQTYANMFNDTQPEVKQSFMKQAVSKQGMTMDWLQSNRDALRDNITTEQAYTDMSSQYGLTESQDAIKTHGKFSKQQQVLESVVSRPDQDISVANYMRSTDFMKQTLDTDQMQSFDKLQSSIYNIPEVSTVAKPAIDSQTSDKNINNTEVQFEQLNSDSDVANINSDEYPVDEPLIQPDTRKLEQLITKNINLDQTSLDQLTAIHDALQTNKNATNTSITSNKIDKKDDPFSVEYFRSIAS